MKSEEEVLVQMIRVVTISAFATLALISSVAARAADASSDPADEVARSFIEAVTTDQISDAYPLLEIGMEMTATGFEIANASANEACDPILNPEG